MPSPVACTIVANNYLAYARVLAESFLAHHPTGRFFTLVVDRPHPSVDYQKLPFTTLFVENLAIPRFRSMAFRYSILELNTAVKPWLLAWLHHQHGHSSALYFDPDILVTASLDLLYERLTSSDLLLTPHVQAPIEDGAAPNERDFLLSGIYNLGFLGIAFNPRTLAFLDWWHRRLERECLHAVERGLFVDQRWMDFAPAFLEHAEVLRDPGCNVAYWNLMHRKPRRVGNSWQVDGSPLRFYHFSGLVWERPDLVSKYQNRFNFRTQPELVPLFQDYRAALAAADHFQLKALPYCYDRFADGTPIPPQARRLLPRVDPAGKRFADPFAVGKDSFLEWLSGETSGSDKVPLSRLAVALWEERADLRQVFPSLQGPSRLAFASWLIGRADHGLDARFLAATQRALAPPKGTKAFQLDRVQRRVWHQLARRGRVRYDHFASEDLSALVADVDPPAERAPRLPRLGLMLHRMRSDLQAAFPDPFAADRRGFALWYATSGRFEYDLPFGLIGPVIRSLGLRQGTWAILWGLRAAWRRRTPKPPANELTPAAAATATGTGSERAHPAGQPTPALALPVAAEEGVNVVGWIAAPTGVGQACRGTLAALAAAQIPHATWSLGKDAFDDFTTGAAAGVGGEGAPYDVDLLHVNADMIAAVSERLPRWVTAGRHRIGYWFWELSHFPLAFATAFEHVDEVWAPTRFCLDAYRPLALVDVRWMPPGVADPRPTAEPWSRADLGATDKELLLHFAFDALSVPERKNPRALLRAVSEAARRSPRPLRLVLKVNHADSAGDLVAELRSLGAGCALSLLTQPLSRAQTDGLIAACDAYVSLHRSEGLGLPLIEAMYCGVPVVATGYGGCTDFLDDEVGWPVTHKLVTLDRAHGPYPVGAVWADPDVEHATEQIMAVASAPEAARAKAEVARQRVEALYSPAAAGERIRHELERIVQARRTTAAFAATTGRRAPALSPLAPGRRPQEAVVRRR